MTSPVTDHIGKKHKNKECTWLLVLGYPFTSTCIVLTGETSCVSNVQFGFDRMQWARSSLSKK